MLRKALTPGDLGRLGEKRAALFYRLRGFSILAGNVRVGRGEVDLIARRGRLLVFVEVKARQQKRTGEPFEAVDREKQLQVISLAERWCHQQRIEGADIRFDVVSLFWNGWRFELEHFPAAFMPEAVAGRPWLWK